MTDSKITYPTVTPYLVVSVAEAELAFIKDAFDGTEVMCQRNADGTVMHAEIRIGDSLVMLGQAGGEWKPLSGARYLWIDDVDAMYARGLRYGATSQSEPEDKPYGHRNAGVVDLIGVTLWLGPPAK